ncbi:MAG: TatD family hydrolase [Candidatus Nealsonbacteria bacterium]
MLIDTHAHLNFNAYKEDGSEVLRRSLDGGVFMINVGSQYSTSQRAVEIAQKYETGVYAAVGLHPIHLETGLVKIKDDPEEIQFKTTEEDFDYEKYKNLALGKNLDSSGIKTLAQSKKAVAIGEVGLDYYWRPKTKARQALFKEKQKAILARQLDLAEELSLPVIFHCRMAHDDLIATLKQRNNITGVIHCFTGDQAQAQKYLEMEFYLGLNGIIFKLNLDEIIEKMPLDRILIETDCPYLTPPPEQGRNEPIFVKYVAEKIAKIKHLSYEEIADITTQNAKKIFKI